MNDSLLEQLGKELFEATISRNVREPLSECYPDITTEDAYAVQKSVIRHFLSTGSKVTGKKIGLTSKAMQDMFGVYEPDFGCLLDSRAFNSGGEIGADTLIQPRVEGEVAFVLKQDLTGRHITARDVIDATAYVTAAIEVVDSRFRNWKIRLADTVADNASFGAYVLGNGGCSAGDVDLRLVGMVLEQNGKVAGTGSGAAVLGHPANCVAWLANRMNDFGSPLLAGEVILSGALTAAVDVKVGDHIRVMFDRLGEVSVCFT